MPAPDASPPEHPPPAESPERAGDALRAAVERTLSATADSATGTRQRAQSLLDDVVRRGQEAREEVARRGEEATTRLAEAIGDLRSAETEEVAELRAPGRATRGRVWTPSRLRLNLKSSLRLVPMNRMDKGINRGESGR